MSAAATSASRRRTRVLLAVVAAYALLIVAVAAYPGPVDRPLEGTILQILGFLHGAGLPTFVSYAWVEFVANIGFYVPIAAALAAVLRPSRRVLVIVALGLVSVTVELIQSQMPGRVGSVLDVVANTSGAALGIAAVVVAGYAKRRARLRAADPASESIAEASIAEGSGADGGDVVAVPLDGGAQPVLEADRRGPAG